MRPMRYWPSLLLLPPLLLLSQWLA